MAASAIVCGRDLHGKLSGMRDVLHDSISMVFDEASKENLKDGKFLKICNNLKSLYESTGDLEDVVSQHCKHLNNALFCNYTYLHYVAQMGYCAYTHTLLQKFPELLEKSNLFGETPIFLAIRSNHFDVTKVLIEYRADLTKQSKEGLTPFHYAVTFGSYDIVKLLLEKGAHVGTAIFKAIQRKHVPITKLLIEHDADLLRKTYKSGRTLLHCAIEVGSYDLVKLFIEKNTRHVNTKDRWDMSPAVYALWRNNLDIFSLLVSSGADTSNALMMAFNNPAACELILKKDRSHIDFQDKGGRTALHYAILYESPKTIAILLSYKPDLYLADARGLNCIDLTLAASCHEVKRLIYRHVDEMTMQKRVDGNNVQNKRRKISS